ncbi:MAG: hypothetical protein GXP35_18800 [Actinobacteria bacterium]|nr:hypothetical protein [Actinomycetota bacterium]
MRLILVLAGGLVLQASVVPVFAIDGRVVDIMMLLAVAGGLLGGADRGVAIGFGAGLGTDLLVQTPFGLWALVGAIVGYSVGVVFGGFSDGGRLLRLMTIGTALVVGTATFVMLGRLLGQDFLADISLVPVLLTVSLGGMVLSPIALRSMAWGLGMDRLPWEQSR